MSLYISKRPRKAAEPWTSGDPGMPNYADTKKELISFCPKPDTLFCLRNPECANEGYVEAKTNRKGLWYWQRLQVCSRCKSLYFHHNLMLAELINIWENQGGRCYRCRKKLPSPLDPIARYQRPYIDHDHRICPQRAHSCRKCRRGLACHTCNLQELSERSIKSWIPPEADEDIGHWLEFIGPERRNQLRDMLSIFPE